MGKFVLINLTNQDSFEFPYFPDEIDTDDEANWETQNTANGIKPSFYGNGEPTKLSLPKLILDNTKTNVSLTETLKKLKALKEEQEDRGAPPPLLATWGDEKLRCVLLRMSTKRIYFDRTGSGNTLRAEISLELLEIQDEGEFTGVNVGT